MALWCAVFMELVKKREGHLEEKWEENFMATFRRNQGVKSGSLWLDRMLKCAELCPATVGDVHLWNYCWSFQLLTDLYLTQSATAPSNRCGGLNFIIFIFECDLCVAARMHTAPHHVSSSFMLIAPGFEVQSYLTEVFLLPRRPTALKSALNQKSSSLGLN